MDNDNKEPQSLFDKYMVTLKALLPKKDYTCFFDAFSCLYEHLAKQLHTIPLSKVRNCMGLPQNWRRLKDL